MTTYGTTRYVIDFLFAEQRGDFFLAIEEPQQKCWRFKQLSDITKYVLPVAQTYLLYAAQADILFVPQEFRKVALPKAPKFQRGSFWPNVQWKEFEFVLELAVSIIDSTLVWTLSVDDDSQSVFPSRLEPVFTSMVKSRMQSILPHLRN